MANLVRAGPVPSPHMENVLGTARAESAPSSSTFTVVVVPVTDVLEVSVPVTVVPVLEVTVVPAWWRDRRGKSMDVACMTLHASITGQSTSTRLVHAQNTPGPWAPPAEPPGESSPQRE